MEWYYVWWPWLTTKCIARVCQHQLSFLFVRLKRKFMCIFFFILIVYVTVCYPLAPNDVYFVRSWHDIAYLCWKPIKHQPASQPVEFCDCHILVTTWSAAVYACCNLLVVSFSALAKTALQWSKWALGMHECQSRLFTERAPDTLKSTKQVEMVAVILKACLSRTRSKAMTTAII